MASPTVNFGNPERPEIFFQFKEACRGIADACAAFNTPVTGGNVLFHGGDMAATWLITGETRAYNAPGGFFKGISPAQTVFEGRPGAWEAVLRLSYIDLDSGMFHGGSKFWRITPMVNWHMSDNLRLEFVYGYGELDRFVHNGGPQFFQARIQTTL